MIGGCAESFGALYDRRQGGVYRFALRMTGSESTAEDVTHDVFFALMKAGSQYDPSRGSVKSYLYGMARHRILRSLERERMLVSIDGNHEEGDGPMPDELIATTDPFNEMARDETVELVRQAILSLPAHFREVIVLCHLQEMNYAEAAEVITCPIGTVRSRLARARAMLVEKLRALEGLGIEDRVIKAGQGI